MRLRLKFFLILTLLSVLASAVAGYGQNESEEEESTLHFDAGSKVFKKRPDGTFTNRFYKGVETRHLDAVLRAEEGIYDSRLGETRFYGDTAFEDSVRKLFADTLIYYENTREALAVGNVRVTEGGRFLSADRVRYLKNKRFISAMGSVEVRDDSTGSIIHGKKAVFDDSTGYGLIVGEPFLQKEENDGSIMTVSCTDTLELFNEEKLIRLWNNVVAVKDSMTMTCTDTLEIMDKEKLVRLWNNVVAVKDSMTAVSEMAVYDDITKTLTLTGNPQIQYVITETRDDAPSELRTVSIVTGDTVSVNIFEKKITGANIRGSAVSTTTSIDTTGAIYDRSIIESLTMRLEMKDDYISLISAEGTAQSYYHRNFTEDKKMFVNNASGDTLTFYFDRGKLTEMKIFGFGGGLGKGMYYDYELEEISAVSDSIEIGENIPDSR